MTLFHQRNPPFRDLDLPIETKSWIDLDNELIRCYQRLIQGLEEVEIEERMEDLQSKAMTSVDHILISIEGPVLSEEDRVWSFQRISEFQDNQKSFCTPVFDGSEADHDLFGMTVPFVEKYKTYGEGSFGIVSKYRIHRDHIIPGNLAGGIPCEVYAVKELKHDSSRDTRTAASHWETEVRAMAKMNTLNHKGHIVHFITAFRRGDREQPEHYLITEWANGGYLENLWKSIPEPQLTEGLTKAVLKQILGLAEAFYAAHNLMSGGIKTGASYRHGDLKPANILWFKPKDGDTQNVIGTLKICDWGEAKNKRLATVMRNTKTTAGSGTIRYQPPEVDIGISQSLAGEAKRRSRLYDMWALGCITLEMIVWLLYGEKGLVKFRNSVRHESHIDPPFYQMDPFGNAIETNAWVHNVVGHWMRHMAQDTACQAGTTILGGLLEIVRTGLLVVKLPAGGGTYVDEVRLPSDRLQETHGTSLSESDVNGPLTSQHQADLPKIVTNEVETDDSTVGSLRDDPVVNIVPPDDEDNLQPKLLVRGPTRLRADQLRDRLIEIMTDEDVSWSTISNTDVPSIPGSLYTKIQLHDNSRRLHGHEVDYGKTHIDTAQWKSKVDKKFAPELFTRIKYNIDYPHPVTTNCAELCDTCQKLRSGIWSALCRIQYDVKSLEYRACQKLCPLCTLLWDNIGESDTVFPEIEIARHNSTLIIDDNKVPRFSICRSPGTTRWLPDIQVGFAELPAPDSKTSLEVLRAWLTDCEDNHEGCKPSNIISSISDCNKRKPPTRLLDIGEGDEAIIFLCETRETTLQGDGEWIALSHRWGAKPYFCTTTDNYRSFKSGIQVGSLPSTFRDAVIVSRTLGCRYLWIDSICIIQEGADADFTKEAKYMEEVYSGAKCVIAASRAEGHEDGFLKPRKRRDYVGLECKEDSNVSFYVCEMIDDFQQHILDGPLNKRGWVLQEHALARRTIFFDEHQTYWECGQGVRCETMTKLENESAKLLGDPNFPKILDSAKQGERIVRFEKLYEQYSRLGLSKQNDRPTAVAGLEQRLLRTMGVNGGFGMLDDPKSKGLLCRSLLWRRGKKIPRLTRIEFLPEQTPAPSWSWMRIDDYTYTLGGINYFEIPFGRYDWNAIEMPWSREGTNENNIMTAEAKEYDCTSAERNLFSLIGDSKNGSVLLKGSCIVLGVEGGSLKYVEKMHYVLLIGRTGRMQSNGLKQWERIGAGHMLGQFLTGDPFEVKIY